MIILDKIGKSIIPNKRAKKYFAKTGSNVPYSVFTILLFLGIVINIAVNIFIIFPRLDGSLNIVFSLIIVQIIVFLIIFFLLWFYYELLSFRRTAELEEVLPDFLQEVSVNLRGGMSFDKALWNSVQPEFGILEIEIENVAKKVMTGEDTEQALKEFSDKYDSTLLKESMDMIIIGLRSGGNISDLIDKIVENVKEASFLRKELIASVTGYIIFITIIAILISPTLFALSFNLMQIIQSLGEKITSADTSGTGIAIPDFKSINPDDFIIYAKISIIIISTVAGMIIADLREGSIKAGFKYLVLFAPISYFVFVIALNLVTGLFRVIV